MKAIGSLFITCLLFISTAVAADLSQVSNSELINELSRRLNGGGGSNPGSGDTAYLIGSCSSGDFVVTLINGEKNHAVITVYMGSSNCAQTLEKTRSKMGSFNGLQVLALCSSGDLVTYSISSSGDVRKSSQYLGASACQKQADIINNLK